MKTPSPFSRLMPALLLLLVSSVLWAQGPPFQTDDPVPVDFQHYEFYIFGGVDGTPVALAPVGPAFEFNWGALPNVQIHAILPLGGSVPSNNPVYLPAGTGSSAFGLTDMELGVKYGFIKQTKSRPQIGTFPMLEIPTGDANKGLGVGRVWYKLPLWVEKDLGHWTIDGGAGYAVVKQTGYRNFPYGGMLIKRDAGKRLELAAEVFAHAREGLAAAQTQASTMIDAGGYYHFKNPNTQLLFAYGHSIAGQTENYAYLGMYWTWGKDKKTTASSALLSGQANRNGF
ncbi:MAG: transporter [Terracidiphilus sp.]|nr:transporter [Terracidiphilus sp.]MDR3776795.1 transporter [Terracidiphilus sp.]